MAETGKEREKPGTGFEVVGIKGTGVKEFNWTTYK